MFRTFSASILLLLATLLPAVSQPGLGFCQCSQNFYVGGCDCEEEESGDCCPLSSHKPSCGCDCEEEAPLHGTIDSPLGSSPCAVDLTLDLSDHLPASSAEPLTSKASEEVLFFGNSESFTNAINILPTVIHDTRGSPAHTRSAPSLPLRIRFSVFLI